MECKDSVGLVKSILIANRGEIAVRIISTCRAMGIKSVAIASVIDVVSPHAKLADQLYVFDADLSLNSTYLNQEKIIEFALDAGVDAIHPGYGFLSENSDFAERVRLAGIIFIGPSSNCIQAMGDKVNARRLAQLAGLPVVPGYEVEDVNFQDLKTECARIGYPVIIKAAGGGGGRGMRVVDSAEDLPKAWQEAQGEAKAAFLSSRMFIEKYLKCPRHIEVQVFGDMHGHYVHLFERECSIQRRHQKVIEETPSVALDNEMRTWVTTKAVDLARALNYVGAGTIEFIMDADSATGKGDLYFLEMNTRLQVEHPITECITNIDLVRWQILVAQGEPLPLFQEQIMTQGHAIECRICAEDPANDFLPVVGRLQVVGAEAMRNVRLDCGYCDGQEVSAYYDSLLAKLIVWGPTRDEAIALMLRALESYSFAGVTNNLRYLSRVIDHTAFREGKTFTNFLSIHDLSKPSSPVLIDEVAVAIALELLQGNKAQIERKSRVWDSKELQGFRGVP
jgi:acetyl/propionyl-CoA carboxylase alpha subunit